MEEAHFSGGIIGRKFWNLIQEESNLMGFFFFFFLLGKQVNVFNYDYY